MPNAVAEGLRRRGIDALTATEAGLRTRPDGDYVARCLAPLRVLVTNDKDFLTLHASGVHHAGILYFKEGSRSIRQLIDALVGLHESFAPDDLADQVYYL